MITGWYDGSSSRWSTDHTRQKLFDNKREAKSVRDELRSLCPRNAKVISVEPELADEKAFAGREGLTVSIEDFYVHLLIRNQHAVCLRLLVNQNTG